LVGADDIYYAIKQEILRAKKDSKNSKINV